MLGPTAGGLKLIDLQEDELDLVVWRYMPFSRFISLLVYQAVWFSKLHILEDKFEGMMPRATMRMMRRLFADWKSIPRHWKRQIHVDNEQSGRELTLVSCWFLSADESATMWRDYGGSTDAVAIKSTIRQLIYHIGFTREPAGIGRVKYVNHRTHMMTAYEANQAQERAFIKDNRFAGEQELRIATFNVKTVDCVSPEGLRYTPEQVEGKHMNNYENPGLYVLANLKSLIAEVRVSPYAGDWLLLLVKRIMDLNGFDIPVLASSVRQLCWLKNNPRWSEYEAAIADVADRAADHRGRILYRGQQDSGWKLSTTLHRYQLLNSIGVSEYYGYAYRLKARLETHLGRTWDIAESLDLRGDLHRYTDSGLTKLSLRSKPE